MDTFDRRQLLRTAVGAGAAVAAGQWLAPTATADDRPAARIKVGQIGTGHEHASAKMAQIPGRYDDQLIELAQIIRGERENPYPLEHELLVQECLLTACGYPLR